MGTWLQAACQCVRSDFSCQYQVLDCPAGSLITNIFEAFRCNVTTSLTPLNADCDASVGLDTDAVVECPKHLETKDVNICAPGIPVGGGNASACDNCKRVTLKGARRRTPRVPTAGVGSGLRGGGASNMGALSQKFTL